MMQTLGLNLFEVFLKYKNLMCHNKRQEWQYFILCCKLVIKAKLKIAHFSSETCVEYAVYIKEHLATQIGQHTLYLKYIFCPNIQFYKTL